MTKKQQINKNLTQCKARRATISVGVMILFSLFLMSFSSALNFDNGIKYENNDMKVSFENGYWFGVGTWFGLNTQMGTAELKSHSTPTEILNVIEGKNRAVMYYDFNFNDIYKNGLGDVAFIDMKTEKEINKDYYFAYAVYEEVDVNDYEDVCRKVLTNNSQSETVCDKNIIGTHKENRFIKWEKLNSYDIPKGKVRIALITNVNTGDFIDGIWTIAGKKISKHATWTASLNVGLVSYWTMNESTGNIIDSLGNHSGSASSSASQSGLINNSRYYAGASSSDWDTIGDINWNGYSALTMNAWVYLVSNSTDGGILAQDTLDYSVFYSYSGKIFRFSMSTDGTYQAAATADTNTGQSILADKWYMVTAVWDGSVTSIYLNGTVQTITGTFTGTPYDPAISYIGRYASATQSLDAKVDEVSVWNRALSSDEVTQLYNVGAGITYTTTFDFPPTVTLHSPANSSVFSVLNIDFNCSAGDESMIQNVSLYVNETMLYNKTNGVTNFTELNTTLNLGVGVYNWTCRAYDNATIPQQGNGTYRFFNITTIPSISYLSPTPANDTNTTETSFVVNVSLTETYFKNLTFYLWNSTSEYQKTVYEDSTRFINFSSLPDGNYTYNATVWTTTNEKNSTLSRTRAIDTNAPTGNITYPLDNVKYQKLNNNLTINWSVSDPHLASCVGSFDNGVNNQSLTCRNNNITVNITSANNNSFMFWYNDTFGNSGNVSRTWDYKVFQTSVLYSSSTTEGATESFKLNFTQGGGLQTSTVNLIYNSTSYASTSTISSGNVSSVNSLAIPNQNLLLTVPFYWNIFMSNGDEINTTSYNQTVDTLLVDNCTTYNILIYNYTVYDEETKDKLTNTTIEIQFNLYDSTRTLNILNFSQIYKEINPAQICMNGTLSTSINYSADSVVKYSSNHSANPYAEEYYNILGQVITNSTVPKHTALYDLLSSDSTDFQLTFKDSSLAFAPNVIVYLYRQYIADNDFKVVEAPLTDSNGQTILHMVRNNVVYNLAMVNATGSVLATFNKLIAFCQDYTIGSCTINLNVGGGGEQIYDYTDDLGISYTKPAYSNTTNLVSFDFISTDLSAKTVSIEIVRESPFGNRSVCTNSLTSSSGTLTCNVANVTSTDRYLFIDISVDGAVKTQSTIDLEAESFNFGIVNGAFYAFLLVLFMITMFMDDKQALVIALGVGWAVVISLGLISGSLVGALSGGIWLIISIIIFLWKLKKEESG